MLGHFVLFNGNEVLSNLSQWYKRHFSVLLLGFKLAFRLFMIQVHLISFVVWFGIAS